jgi:hypothetical protein
MLNSNVSACSLDAIRYQRKSDRGYSMQLWWNASVVKGLEEENGRHSSETESTVHCAKRGSSAGLVVTAAVTVSFACAIVSLSGGVNKLALALVATLNELL